MESEFVKRYTTGEEICNAISHGLGAVFAVSASTLMITASVLQKDWMKLAASIIYGASLILLYLMSTLYHAFSNERVKRVLRVFDHCSIFLLIAGTYTPFTMISLRGITGWYLFAFIWTGTVLGIVLNIVSIDRFRYLSMACYVIMGWAVVVTFKPLVQSLSSMGLFLLLLGGILYTVGILFYSRRIPYMHFIWHLFVLGGSICHFLAIYLYVLL